MFVSMTTVNFITMYEEMLNIVKDMAGVVLVSCFAQWNDIGWRSHAFLNI